MRIIYGVSGEGFGHSSRAKQMISHLQKKGHQILVITYGQAYPVLKKQFNTYKIGGIRLIYDKKGRLSIPNTIADNISPVLKNIKNLGKITKRAREFSPDIFITDFEPITAIVSYILQKPLISIDNQRRLTHLDISVPLKYKKDFLIAKTATAINPPRADAYIILSFAKSKPKSKKAFVVSPILRKKITKLRASSLNFILVYQTKPDKKFISLLRKIPQKFIVYGYNIKKREKNIIYKEAGEHFINDLAKAKAVIASAGFTLMSEALYLKKPYFAIPLKGQFEQTINAIFLKKAGFGDFSENPTKEQIDSFLSSINKCRARLRQYKTSPHEAMNVMDKLIKKFAKKR
jgi:uncharacterized protein (TIGR00661 family)